MVSHVRRTRSSRSRSAGPGSSSAFSRTSPPRSRATASPSTQSPTGTSFRTGVGGQLLTTASRRCRSRRRSTSSAGCSRSSRGARRLEFGKPLDTQPLADLDVSFEDVPRAARPWPRPRTSTSPPGPASSSAAIRPRSRRSTCSPGWPASTTAPGRGTRRSRTSSARARRASSRRSPGTAAPTIRLSSPVQRVEQDERRGQRSRRGDGRRSPRPSAVVAAPLNTWHDIVFEPELSEPSGRPPPRARPGTRPRSGRSSRTCRTTSSAVGWGGGLNWVSTEFVLPEGQLLVGFGTGPELLDVTSRTTSAGPSSASSRTRASSRPTRTTGTRTSSRSGTWMAYRPGQLTRFHSAFQETEGRLAFAGSDLALGWAGWMDGAVETGARAAAQVVEMLLASRGVGAGSIRPVARGRISA